MSFALVCTVEIVNRSITVDEGNPAVVCVEKSGAQTLESFTVVINPSVFSPPEAACKFIFKETQCSYTYFLYVANSDYDQNSKDVLFNPGDDIKCVEIDTLQDTVLETIERFLAVLILPADTVNLGVTPGDRTETPISIVDDDGNPL